MARVVLAMSGGVDSSVAADLLLQDGHEVIGVFMRHGEESAAACRVEPTAGSDESSHTALPIVDNKPMSGGRADHKQGCCSATDAADARRVASRLGIPFYALDLQKDFRRIVDYFVDDYLNGRTPNPCVKCNHWIKFGRLFDYADDVQADYVATGHYARLINAASGPELHRGLDGKKDQSYALFGIARHRLERMLLPVGDFEKPEIRRRAGDVGLNVATKRDSQEICFVTQGHHSDFVKSHRPELVGQTAGDFVLTDGRVVGKHDGYEAFTIGQRKGLGIALGEPHFVVKIDTGTRQVVLGKTKDLLASGLHADNANWLVDPACLPDKLLVQFRYNSPPHAASVIIDPHDSTRFQVVFDDPQSAIAPGQAAVVYEGTRVIGGGWITSAIAATEADAGCSTTPTTAS